jgi:hypothetical protein
MSASVRPCRPHHCRAEGALQDATNLMKPYPGTDAKSFESHHSDVTAAAMLATPAGAGPLSEHWSVLASGGPGIEHVPLAGVRDVLRRAQGRLLNGCGAAALGPILCPTAS